MSLFTLIKGKRGASGFGYASTAEEVTAGFDLTGKRILITGVNSGLGYESARVLSMRGAHIIGAARTLEKASAACENLPGEATPTACELSDPTSVRGCVETLKAAGEKLDVILCNAGIATGAELERQHGYEPQFFTNHMGHFILVTSLLDLLAENGRVVMVSSEAHKSSYKEGIQFDNLTGEREYNPFKGYGQSKLANLLFARELGRRFEGVAKAAFAIHPGAIATNITRSLPPVVAAIFGFVSRIGAKNVEQGAATQCYVAVHPDAAAHNGDYYVDCNLAESSPQGRDVDMATRLWEASEKIAAAPGS